MWWRETSKRQKSSAVTSTLGLWHYIIRPWSRDGCFPWNATRLLDMCVRRILCIVYDIRDDECCRGHALFVPSRDRRVNRMAFMSLKPRDFPSVPRNIITSAAYYLRCFYHRWCRDALTFCVSIFYMMRIVYKVGTSPKTKSIVG